MREHRAKIAGTPASAGEGEKKMRSDGLDNPFAAHNCPSVVTCDGCGKVINASDAHVFTAIHSDEQITACDSCQDWAEQESYR